MSTFSDNLRAEMARKGMSVGTLQHILFKAGSPVVAHRLQRFRRPVASYMPETSAPESVHPTPAEVTAIAAALEVPESRLTVSREELEAEVERLRSLLNRDLKDKIEASSPHPAPVPCQICGQPVQAKRRTRMYCDRAGCRKAAQRAKNKARATASSGGQV